MGFAWQPNHWQVRPSLTPGRAHGSPTGGDIGALEPRIQQVPSDALPRARGASRIGAGGLFRRGENCAMMRSCAPKNC